MVGRRRMKFPGRPHDPMRPNDPMTAAREVGKVGELQTTIHVEFMLEHFFHVAADALIEGIDVKLIQKRVVQSTHQLAHHRGGHLSALDGMCGNGGTVGHGSMEVRAGVKVLGVERIGGWFGWVRWGHA